MNISSLQNKILLNIDVFCDYIPVVSAITNLGGLFTKHVVAQGCPKPVEDSFYAHILNKSTVRFCVLLIPIFGNISIFMYDTVCNFSEDLNRYYTDPDRDVGEGLECSSNTRGYLDVCVSSVVTPIFIAGAILSYTPLFNPIFHAK